MSGCGTRYAGPRLGGHVLQELLEPLYRQALGRAGARGDVRYVAVSLRGGVVRGALAAAEPAADLASALGLSGVGWSGQPPQPTPF